MHKSAYVAGGCVLVWIILLQLAFTGFSVSGSGVREPTMMTHINTALILAMLLFTMGILYVRLKKEA